MTASVLTGVLLARLGRDAESLQPDAPEPVRPRAGESAGGARGATGDRTREKKA